MTAVVELTEVSRSYGEPAVMALDRVSLRIDEGELVAIVGPSGSGKSTLLNVIGTLDRPTSGRVVIRGAEIEAMSDAALSALRAHHIGFVFQQFHLADGVRILDNVADGLLYTGTPLKERRRRAEEALARVGLDHRLRHRPHELSGGERQRVAIARALMGSPSLILADEPTGNLDSISGENVMHTLESLNDDGITVVIITHDHDLANRMPRQVHLADGHLIHDDAVLRADDGAGVRAPATGMGR